MTCPCTPSRRTVLTAAGAVGAAGLLAACGGGSASPNARATGGPEEDVITGLAALREAGALEFETPDGPALAIAQGDDVLAYSAVCPHQGCTVGYDAGAEALVCPCHGSRFQLSDGGVVNGPARQPLASVDVVVDEDAGVLRRS